MSESGCLEQSQELRALGYPWNSKGTTLASTTTLVVRINMLFQLSSYQLNELMRVLTMFSTFFIPLSFIASVYGMNFSHLPWVDSKYGPVYCGIVMIAVGSSTSLWFKSKRFF